MKNKFKNRNKLVIFPVILVSLICTSCGENYKYKSGFAGYLTAERVEIPLYYEDEYFDESSTKYNEHLATSSALLALSGFSATIGSDYINSPNNAKDFFNVTGFSNFKSNTFGVTQPTLHSFGVYMASKKIKDYTLIGITTRGAGYLAEWGSNFLLGKDGDFATGFGEASDIYLDTLRSYISEQNIKGKIKIWAAGYSRGGAGTNLSIGRIDEAISKNEAILGEDVTFSKDDVFAYCFEAPAGRIATVDSAGKIYEKTEPFNNIHCLVNLNDMVPMVGPLNFGFVRYGKDYYLPDIISDLNYSKYIKQVKDYLANLPNANIVGEYLVDRFNYAPVLSQKKRHNWTMGRFLNAFIGELASTIGSRNEYSNSFEKPLADIFDLIYKNGTPKDSLIDFGINIGKTILLRDDNEMILVDIQHNRSRVWQDLKPHLQMALEKTRIGGVNIDELMDLIKSVVLTILNIATRPEGLACLPSLINFNNFKALASGHFPELLLSHMKALDSNYNNQANNKVKDSYFTFVVHVEDDFVIKNNGTVIAKFDGGMLETGAVAEIDGNAINFFIPEEKGYTIESNTKLDVDIYRNSGLYDAPIKLSDSEEKEFVGGNV